MAMPPGNNPNGFPGTHQPNQINQPNQPNQLNQPNQPNQPSQPTQLNQPAQPNQQVQINQTNQANQLSQFDTLFQMVRNTASSPNLAQLNQARQQQHLTNLLPQQAHNQGKQQDRAVPTPPVSPTVAANALAAIFNPSVAANLPPAISNLFKKLRTLNTAQGQNANPLSFLRFPQLPNQQNNLQQRPKANMQHMHLPQMQAPGASISSSASTPTLSALSSTPSGPIIQQPSNQAILAPRQQMSSKKQKEFPKVEVSVTSQSLPNCIQACGLSNSFLERIDKFEVSNNVKLNPKSISTIAMALYLRMHHIVEQSVKNSHIRLSSKLYMNEHQIFLEKQKQLQASANETNQQKQTQSQLQQKMSQEFQQRALSLLPGEPIFTDIPMANVAIIEAERRIIDSGLPISKPTKEIDNTFNIYRNQVLCGVAARSPEQMREKIASYTKEMPDNVQPDLASIAQLGLVQTTSKFKVTFDDVYQVIENDIMFTPEKLLLPKFYLQARKIANMQSKRSDNDES